MRHQTLRCLAYMHHTKEESKMKWIRGNLSSIMFVAALPVALFMGIKALPPDCAHDEPEELPLPCPEKGPAFGIRIREIDLSAPTHRTDTREIRAFIATNGSGGCLATLAESTLPLAGTTIYCAAGVDFGGGKGIDVHLFLPMDIPNGASWTVSIYHEGATIYDAPVIFDP